MKTNRSETAVLFHRERNMNCAQSVLCAFGDRTGLPEETAMAIAEGFGGGVRSGEICGAVSGAVMALGLIKSAEGEGMGHNPAVKSGTIEIAAAFRRENGCLRCRDLLASKKEKQCDKYIADAVNILEKMIEGETK